MTIIEYGVGKVVTYTTAWAITNPVQATFLGATAILKPKLAYDLVKLYGKETVVSTYRLTTGTASAVYKNSRLLQSVARGFVNVVSYNPVLTVAVTYASVAVVTTKLMKDLDKNESGNPFMTAFANAIGGTGQPSVGSWTSSQI